MKLDGETIQTLYSKGLISEKTVKHINILNSLEALKMSGEKRAVAKIAAKYKCSAQNVYLVLKKDRTLK